jgi:hypothetical protein
MGLERRLRAFGLKGFRGALIGCVALAIVGLSMAQLGGDAPRSVGISFIDPISATPIWD